MMPPDPQWFEQQQSGAWMCTLCPHHCTLQEGGIGRCRVRAVRDGRPVDLGFGHIPAMQIDPIEKKPLFHFMPGSHVFSIGGYGCNLRCAFCQNWHIAQCRRQEMRTWEPEEIVAEAAASNCIGIAYTYNEPLIGYPFLHATATKARQQGLLNVLVTNGYIEASPAQKLLEVMDAINLDIKSMNDAFYRSHCGGHLAPVLAFARQVHAAGIHLEITNLLIPGQNDEPAETQALAQWIAGNLAPTTALHLTAYHPAFEMHTPQTPKSSVLAACQLARKHLEHVYCGNIVDRSGAQNTTCRSCGNLLVARHMGKVSTAGLSQAGHCRKCDTPSNIRQP